MKGIGMRIGERRGRGKRSDVLWPPARHTAAKHQLLKDYLDAWIGILGSWADHVLLVDGFTGAARRLVGARACPPGWWVVVRRPGPCRAGSAGRRPGHSRVGRFRIEIGERQSG